MDKSMESQLTGSNIESISRLLSIVCSPEDCLSQLNSKKARVIVKKNLICIISLLLSQIIKVQSNIKNLLIFFFVKQQRQK